MISLIKSPFTYAPYISLLDWANPHPTIPCTFSILIWLGPQHSTHSYQTPFWWHPWTRPLNHDASVARHAEVATRMVWISLSGHACTVPSKHGKYPELVVLSAILIWSPCSAQSLRQYRSCHQIEHIRYSMWLATHSSSILTHSHYHTSDNSWRPLKFVTAFIKPTGIKRNPVGPDKPIGNTSRIPVSLKTSGFTCND